MPGWIVHLYEYVPGCVNFTCHVELGTICGSVRQEAFAESNVTVCGTLPVFDHSTT